MRFAALYIALLIAYTAKCQENKEFEGVISYQHKIIFSSPDVDSSDIINYLGTTSTLFYRNGNYKWVINSPASSKNEYFDTKTQTVYYLFEGSDTLFMSVKKGYDDSLAVFNINDTDEKICGLQCKKAETILFSKYYDGSKTKRTVYYSPTVPVSATRFSLYRTYATNKVIKKIRSWPLKIVLETDGVPFTFILEAISIVPLKLSDEDVKLPPAMPIRSLF